MYETGYELEEAVKRCFNQIGINTTDPTKSDEDGIIEYGDVKFMVEIKGRENGSAEWSQFSKLIARIEASKTPKNITGIFIMNHFADTPIENRENPFPDNLLKTASATNTLLLTTVDLFEIVRKVLDGEVEKEKAFEELLKSSKKYCLQ